MPVSGWTDLRLSRWLYTILCFCTLFSGTSGFASPVEDHLRQQFPDVTTIEPMQAGRYPVYRLMQGDKVTGYAF